MPYRVRIEPSHPVYKFGKALLNLCSTCKHEGTITKYCKPYFDIYCVYCYGYSGKVGYISNFDDVKEGEEDEQIPRIHE